MAKLVLLVPASGRNPSLPAAAVSELARLGVTSVAVLRDDRTMALVLEGWAFDPGRSAEAVVAAVTAPASPARTLHPLMEMAVSAAPDVHGGDES